MVLLLLTTRIVAAESYGLQCSIQRDPVPIILTVRDGWSRFVAPTIRVHNGLLGETSPVDLESYTADKIRLTIRIEIEKFPHEASVMTLTIDRNTGAAQFELYGPQRLDPKSGASWRENISISAGQCKRQTKKF